MKKTNLYILLILVLIISLVSYSLKDRVDVSQTVLDFQNFLYSYDDFDDELPVYFPDNPCENTGEAISISKEEAGEDIENLFSLLKYGYSAYGFFGGDPVFDLARENMIADINSLEYDYINKNTLTNIISSNLDFIQDSHFSVGSERLCDYTRYFSSKTHIFYKDFKGYYTYIDDEIYYLDKINDGAT